ncbi:peptidyl-prolyl cis-trans isomerase-like 3 [Cryptococcus neoformans]|nr:peptidyl-prolyl cis-trans isomerase-like 3 [Cryptococcus neoformans var. grubii]OWZ72926.1 peptidyl-prolyl cis-trans isomerase-like 3 [Cryptococcus neoformans var. grubii]OXC67681.1 peptidyl-prolyl cis-trans isomerase-like 3 [Cryptococcus neoformans var. grubii]
MARFEDCRSHQYLTKDSNQNLDPISQPVRMSVTLHTNVGDIKIELFCETVPRTAENFLALCASGQYDGTLFHRNIRGFMIQGGDPTGTGKGGQSIWGRPFADEIRQTLRFNNRGMVAMANAGPDTNKSQFFITYAKQPSLDGKYSIFGKVIDGIETLDSMEKTPVNPKNRPLQEIKLLNVTIHANPIADQAKGGLA